MVPLRRQILLNALKLADLVIMTISFVLAASIASFQISTVSLVEFLSMRISVHNFALFLALLYVWHLLFSLFGLYHSRRLSTGLDEVADIMKATSLGTIVIFITAGIFNIRVVTPIFVGIFWAVSGTTSISTRLILRYVLAQVRLRGRNVRHVLILGTNPRAVEFARTIQTRPELGYRLVGFLDDQWDGIEEFRKTNSPLIGSVKELPNMLRERVIDEVVITLPIKSFYSQTSQIVALCEQQGIIARVSSEIFKPALARSKPEEFEDSSMISFYTGGMHGWSVEVKRALDFSLSLASLILFAPLFFVTALVIKVTSPGAIFFVQERVGLNKRRFRLYKFRTMVPDAEQKMAELEHLNEVSGPVFKIKDDPRLTPIGKFLRRTSIDELPQLWNVLKGDMSLVGPRPLPVRDYNGFDQDWQRRRFSVRPGITCLWQVNGRSDLSFDKWMEMDMQYIDQWSLWLDIKILAQTVPAVLRGSGAA